MLSVFLSLSESRFLILPHPHPEAAVPQTRSDTAAASFPLPTCTHTTSLGSTRASCSLSRGMLWRAGGDLNAIGVAPPVGQPEVSMEAAPPHPVDRPWLPSGTLVVPSSSQQISDPLVCQEPADTEQRSSQRFLFRSPRLLSVPARLPGTPPFFRVELTPCDHLNPPPP